MTTKKVTLVELHYHENVTPLVSAYLQLYACKDSLLRDEYAFERYCVSTAKSAWSIIHDLQRKDATVYTFSCYCWNTRLVKSVLKQLLKAIPRANFILGGPQVANYGRKYLDPQHPNVVICNGEGETTFSSFLRELTEARPDFSKVCGLTFYADNELITTKEEKRIENLDEIPSPYLRSILSDDKYVIALLEASRGCPFSCAFCSWPGSNRVRKFSNERVKEEIRWLSKKGYPSLWLADANWGIYKRDVEISKYIAECKQQYGYPEVVSCSTAKHQPERAVEIGRIWQKAGIDAPIEIAFQSLNPVTLQKINRKNISFERFSKLQKQMNEEGLISGVDLIWPLPGETLSTFKRSINKLCEVKAECNIFNLALLNGSELDRKRDEYGLVTIAPESHSFEAEQVIQTSEVNSKENLEGIYFCNAMKILYSFRWAYCLGHYLNSSAKLTYSKLFTDFADYCKSREKETPLSELKQAKDHIDFRQKLMDVYRGQFEVFLSDFVNQQNWINDTKARTCFEIDLINTPYVSADTPIREKHYTFECIRVQEITSHGYVVQIPEYYHQEFTDLVQIDKASYRPGCIFNVTHKINLPNTPDNDEQISKIKYFHTITQLLPVWYCLEKVKTVVP